jgi:hypothetical protein
MRRGPVGLDRARAICLGAALAIYGACGPIEYVSHVTTGAGPAIEAARSADAAKWSPYWWTRANEYFHKAREEAAYSHFEAANHFGRLSEDAAAKAREEALRRAADPDAAAKEMGPLDGAPVVAPPASDKPDKPDKPGKARKSPGKLAPTEETP